MFSDIDYVTATLTTTTVALSHFIQSAQTMNSYFQNYL